MHVSPHRLLGRRARQERRPFVIGAPAPAPEAPAAATEADHLDERRHRAAVSPEDSALYSCACGLQFHAPVSASVACPHCGGDQAW